MPTVHDEGIVASSRADGPRLYFTSAVPQGEVKAAVGLIHGFAEYGARYAHVIEVWAERGIATVTIDLRGHGRSEGRRGFCERFSQYLDDAATLVPLLDERAPGAPTFLFGHSLGGLVAASLVIATPSPWRGVVLSAPYLGLALDVPPGQILVGKVASRLIPKFAQRSGLSGADLTHDAARARAYDEDPLIFKTVTSRWFTETRKGQARALAQAPSLAMPLYVVVGTADRVAKVETARAFFDAAGSHDKTWDARTGLFHEVLNEPEWRDIADKIAEWILTHSRTPPLST